LSDGRKKELYQYIQFFHGALQFTTYKYLASSTSTSTNTVWYVWYVKIYQQV